MTEHLSFCLLFILLFEWNKLLVKFIPVELIHFCLMNVPPYLHFYGLTIYLVLGCGITPHIMLILHKASYQTLTKQLITRSKRKNSLTGEAAGLSIYIKDLIFSTADTTTQLPSQDLYRPPVATQQPTDYIG